MSVGFGLIGSGFMAHTYAQCLKEHVPDGHLVAVAEGSRAAGLAAEYGVDHVATAAELLARDDVDAALICTPHSTHRALTEAAWTPTTTSPGPGSGIGCRVRVSTSGAP